MNGSSCVPTICRDCEHLYVVNKNDRWYRWLCIRSPVTEINFVSGTIDPPYKLCRFVNYGECAMFEPDKHPKPNTVLEYLENQLRGD